MPFLKTNFKRAMMREKHDIDQINFRPKYNNL